MRPPVEYETWRQYERAMSDIEGRCPKCYGEMTPSLRVERDWDGDDDDATLVDTVEWLVWRCGCGWQRPTKTGDAQ